MATPPPPAATPSSRRFEREGEGLEFARLVNFTDAIFAIAMTLLVVAVAVPAIRDGSSVDELARALDDTIPDLVAFVIGFLVIGQYWVAHHRFIARLQAVDGVFIAISMGYLLLIAFLPFPTGLLGEYFENPLAVGIFAVTAAAVSGMEAVLFVRAHRANLNERELPDDVYDYGLVASLVPVGWFLLSVPVAWIASWLAVLVWALSFPAQAFWGRYAPPGAAEYYV